MYLHMNVGLGETSYANNSQVQRTSIYKTEQILEEAVGMLCSAITPKTITIADLGCSSGPNSLLPTSMILNAVQNNYDGLRLPMPEFHIFLNDLPYNDFNTLFKNISPFLEMLRVEKKVAYESCFICGSPGSFYGRLFPAESLHFVYSANSLHWLSEVPSNLGLINKGNIGIGKTSPSLVFEIYLEQFRRDFIIFLESRSKEIVPRGCMVLTLLGRGTTDHSFSDWDTLADALSDMVNEGIVEETKMDSFNMPYYEPHIEEVRKVIEEEGSFNIIQLIESCSQVDYTSKSTPNSLSIRAVIEPILSHHFGPAIMDELFSRDEEKSQDAQLEKMVVLRLSLSRKG